MLGLGSAAEFKGKICAYFHSPVEAVRHLRWSTQGLNLVNIKMPEPKQGYVFEGKICEYFHTPVKAVIIKHRGDQLQTLILLTLKSRSLYWSCRLEKRV